MEFEFGLFMVHIFALHRRPRFGPKSKMWLGVVF